MSSSISSLCSSPLNVIPSTRLLSLFDSLGPVMTGPSSSHTAGMARIGKIAHNLMGGTPDTIRISVYGALSHTYKGHASDSAIVGGLLGEAQDSPLLRNALALAREKGISVEVNRFPEDKRNPNTITIVATLAGKAFSVAGVSMGGGEVQITRVDGYSVVIRGNESGCLIVSPKNLNQEAVEAITGKLEKFSCAATAESLSSSPPERCPVDLSEEYKTQRAQANGGTEGVMYLCLSPQPLAQNILDKLADLATGYVYPIKPISDLRLKNTKPAFNSFASYQEVAATFGEDKTSGVAAGIAYEEKRSGFSKKEIYERVSALWNIMRASVEEGLAGNNDMLAGFVPSNEGQKLQQFINSGNSLTGSVVGSAIAAAIAVMECNASMGCVVAAPTAGACGMLPGALWAMEKSGVCTTQEVIDGLIVAASVGVICAQRITISGAVGGCQSEIGVGSAMTAAALTAIKGGDAHQICHAAALSLKNTLGLICDPVGGPVEVPCIKRNAMGIANAFASADMALAGITSRIPPDEVVDALLNVQSLMHADLRGNLKGGLASTRTGKELKDAWYDKMKIISN